jgi:hypothetical protein
MNDCLITFIEKIFNTVDNERIMQNFQNTAVDKNK